VRKQWRARRQAELIDEHSTLTGEHKQKVNGVPMLEMTAAPVYRDFSTMGTEVLAAARARLANSHTRYQREKAPRNDIYYPSRGDSGAEQSITDIDAVESLDAVVTRNHYGSIVLNAHHAMFIDVDMPDPSDPPHPGYAWKGPINSLWKSTFEDLCTVLESERGTGFRVYRTAAGFRVLAVTHEFDPGSDAATDLMASVGADDAFVRLCGTQKTFRARLSPKPWRCGTTRPPNDFPRLSAEDQSCFAAWLREYDRRCRDRATCQFLDDVGPSGVHERIAPIVEFHDRETKAFAALELA
jgi:hypothetical protein